MKSWKHLPYWLRGGVIGGGVILTLFAPFYACLFAVGWQINFVCPVFLFAVPVYPVALISDNLNLSFFSGQLSFVLLPLSALILWFFIGALFGLLVGYIKSKNKKLS